MSELRTRAPGQSALQFVLSELKPKGKIVTPFNVVTGIIVIVGLWILVVRFTQGLGAVTNLSQAYPWGFWIGFDVVTGVAFAGGAYIVTFFVYIMRAEKYRPIVRVTVLNGLLAYFFYADALFLDLGRPWNIINPIIGNSFGYNSVLFLVAWHFLLYMMAEFVEVSPAMAEWVGFWRVHWFMEKLALGAVIFGITLSMLHQSGLGALYLMAKPKIHPLWYSEFIPILFLVSSVFAGLSMVIFEGTISRKVLAHLHEPGSDAQEDSIVIGLSRAAAIAMFAYFFFKVVLFIHDKQYRLLGDGWGAWYLVEVLGFVLLPCVMFAWGYRHRSVGSVRAAATMTMVGIVLNRLNISVIAYNWNAAVRYYPSWQEIVVTLMIISLEIWAFRWIVNRMPVIHEARVPDRMP